MIYNIRYKEVMNANQTLLFKDVTVSDKETILRYTLSSPYRNCDFSFSNLCSWRFMYNTQFAEAEGFLLMKFWSTNELFYMIPVGSGDLRAAVELLIRDAALEKKPLHLLGLSQESCTLLDSLMPHTFHFASDRDYADYLYLRSDLATLGGKKFQAKRNHVNKFRRTYNYQYLPLSADLKQECLDLEAAWCIVNNCDQFEGTGNERRALVYALHNFDALGLTGGILHADGKIVAFTFGMPINGDTFGVHVEKADTLVDGAYAMINYEFANHIPEQYRYINREEDLGIEGLRKAKLSYQPTLILEKFSATLQLPNNKSQATHTS
jgi:hypothetical protein